MLICRFYWFLIFRGPSTNTCTLASGRNWPRRHVSKYKIWRGEVEVIHHLVHIIRFYWRDIGTVGRIWTWGFLKSCLSDSLSLVMSLLWLWGGQKPYYSESRKNYANFSNSLIIHKENTKEINVSWVFGNQMKNCYFCILNFSF